MGHVFGGLAVDNFADDLSRRKSIGNFTKGIVCPRVNFETMGLLWSLREKKDCIGEWGGGHAFAVYCSRRINHVSADTFEKHG